MLNENFVFQRAIKIWRDRLRDRRHLPRLFLIEQKRARMFFFLIFRKKKYDDVAVKKKPDGSRQKNSSPAFTPTLLHFSSYMKLG